MNTPKPKLVDVSSLILAEYNPRKISEQDKSALRASILAHGFVVPIVVQEKTNIIIGGHQRITVLREMYGQAEVGQLIGEDGKPIPLKDLPKKVWAMKLDIDEHDAKRLNVSLNHIGGEFDELKLAEVFQSLLDEDQELDLLSMGFEQESVDDLLGLLVEDNSVVTEAAAASDGVVGSFGKSITLALHFDTVEQRDEVKDKIQILCKPKGIKAGDLLLAAINKGKLGKLPKA